VHVRVCRPARQVGSPVLQGSFPRLATLRPRGLRVVTVWVARLDHVVHVFPLPGCFAADGLFVPSCSRGGDQEGSPGVERRDIEAFRADVDLVRPRGGVTSASLDRGHVEGGAAPRCEHHSGPYAPALGIVTIYSAPTRMPSLRARRTHQPIQGPDQREMFLPAAGDKIEGRQHRRQSRQPDRGNADSWRLGDRTGSQSRKNPLPLRSGSDCGRPNVRMPNW
jgi:hypothetical protein